MRRQTKIVGSIIKTILAALNRFRWSPYKSKVGSPTGGAIVAMQDGGGKVTKRAGGLLNFEQGKCTAGDEKT